MPPEPYADVAVVGGGPAGSAAAIALARGGYTVTLVDKARFPRDKTCGDGLTTGALRLLDGLGLDPSQVASWQPVDDVVLRSPSGRSAAFPMPRGRGTYAAVARRTHLDAALLDVARAAGVNVMDGHACTDAAERADHVEVEIEGFGTLTAPWLVAADGMWSPVRRYLGLTTPGYRGEWHAFRQYFTEVAPQARASLFVWFEPDLLPGYAWSFPLPDGQANVGFGIRRDGGKVRRTQDMAGIWRELVNRPHIRSVLGSAARPESRHRAWPIPTQVDRAVLAGRRTLFVGDAVAAGDVLTGEGIGQALLTGLLAAEAIDHGHEVRATYRRLVTRALLADHHMSQLLHRGLRHRKGARTAVRFAGATAWTRRNFGRWLFEDYPRAIFFTPRRWHGGILDGPGAFARNGAHRRDTDVP